MSSFTNLACCSTISVARQCWLGIACSTATWVQEGWGFMHVQLAMLTLILNQAAGLQGDLGVG